MTIEEFIIDLDSMQKFTKGSGPIVVVDDDPSQLFIVKECYEKSERDNKLILLESSEDFLSLVNDFLTGAEPIPELVLLDINMNKISGFDLLKMIRESEGFRKVPIIVVFSSSDSWKDKEKARIYGANGFFSKPTHVSDYIKFFQMI